MIGGGTLSCFDVIEALNKANFNVKLVLPKGESQAKQLALRKQIEVLDENLEILTFSYYNGGNGVLKSVIKLLLKFKYIIGWIKLLKKENPDVVILNSIVQWPMIILLKFLGIKNICFIRETMKGSSGSAVNRAIKIWLKLSNGISYLSQYGKHQWKLKCGINQVVIPDKISEDVLQLEISKKKARDILKLEENKFYVLFLGGLSKLKGTHVIIDAISKMENENIELIILGDLSEKLRKSGVFCSLKYLKQIFYLKEMSKKIEKNTKIKMVGLQSSTNDWYAACDLVVFPAEKAHQARPLYEAGAFKKPIIISDFPNYREYVSKGINGLTFIPNDSEDLSRKIQLLMDNKFQCENMGKKNYDFTLKYHNSKTIDILISDFVSKIIS